MIHDIVFHGNGGYSWYDVYNMPIWLRKFTFNKIKNYFEQQNEKLKPKEVKKDKIPKPNIDYSYKAPKK